MASEKELFVTKQYVPMGDPISQNDHTVIYKVKCIAEPGQPIGILKMYRKQNIKNLYERLRQLDYTEWPHVYNVKYFDGSTLVIEEYLQGSTLAQLLERNRRRGFPFSEREATEIMEKICQNIEDLMKLDPPIVHHNLKPSNIFVTSSGAVKFLDFIPNYLKIKNPFSGLLKNLGSIFHEMLTGHKPKKGQSSYRGRYEKVIRKCLENKPEDQYSTMDEMRSDIDYAKTHAPEETNDPEKVGIPYTLTIPFHGTILGMEWFVFCYFFVKNNVSTSLLFVGVFLLHSAIFAFRRYSFLKKENIYLGLARTLVPILILAGILAGIYAATVFLIQ